jgi:hypothetical protein
VGLHDVPRESVGQHLGLMTDDETLSKDELDDKLARKFFDSSEQQLISFDVILQSTLGTCIGYRKRMPANPTQTSPKTLIPIDMILLIPLRAGVVEGGSNVRDKRNV